MIHRALGSRQGESATYGQAEGVMRGPGPVTFKRGRLSGSGVDFSYDETQDLLALADQTHVIIAPEKRGGDPTDITSGAAVLGRTDNFLSFERNVHIVRGSQVIVAPSALGISARTTSTCPASSCQADRPSSRRGHARRSSR